MNSKDITGRFGVFCGVENAPARVSATFFLKHARRESEKRKRALFLEKEDTSRRVRQKESKKRCFFAASVLSSAVCQFESFPFKNTLVICCDFTKRRRHTQTVSPLRHKFTRSEASLISSLRFVLCHFLCTREKRSTYD